MMQSRPSYFAFATAAALLILGAAAPAIAGEEMAAAEGVDEPVALTGCLLESEEGIYSLDEFEAEEATEDAAEAEDSGEIALEGEGLDEHVGHTVTVTGEWSVDDAGDEYFTVASLEHVAATCAA